MDPKHTTNPDPEDQRGIPTIQQSQPPSHSTRTLDDSRFTPGMLLADRYRMVGRIGRGGMGEVYRADDMKLGQSVALKFLPQGLARDPKWLGRFHDEVRIAREIAHPNVCRTYDIGEFEGEHFISMEYVDGEDLSSLINRIGRLPKDKAIQIAKQLCTGLAAAHDKGVLHRDLKPANIMLDGRGNVRITDFGIAAVADQIEGANIKAGTPAYMAPEQLAGESVSVRSDIYSLGLVLYEVFTGREAYDADSISQLQDLRRTSSLSTPSSLVEDMDPLVERVIMRCLEDDATRRPGSAIAVAAALPGGDPLAMALAAGETPSPDMVAQSGESGGLRPAVAVACMAAFVGLMVLFLGITSTRSVLGYIPFDKPTPVLADRARQVISEAGYGESTAHGVGFFTDLFSRNAYQQWIMDHDESLDRWERLRSGRPPVIVYQYRAGSGALSSFDTGSITWNDPPNITPGMCRLQLDPEGRLLWFEAVPPDRVESIADEPGDPAPEGSNDVYASLFEAAEVDRAQLTEVEPTHNPPMYCDSRSAWSGQWPGSDDVEVRVEAGELAGKPVYFRLLGPWQLEDVQASSNQPPSFMMGVFFALFFGLPILGGVFCVRNLRAGRGDRRGAWRLAIFVMIATLAASVFGAQTSESFGVLTMLPELLLLAAGSALVTWVLYIAIEPYARRYWPHAIISWSRLLAGKVRDPMVGRDVLIGSLFGMGLALPQTLGDLWPSLLGRPPAAPLLMRGPEAFGGIRPIIANMAEAFTDIGLFFGLYVLLLVLRIVLRRQWIAVGIIGVLFVMASTDGFSALSVDRLDQWIAGVFLAFLLLTAMIRFGLLTVVAMSVVGRIALDSPITFDFSAWYAGIGLSGPIVALAIAGYAFWIALAGQPLFKDDLAA